MWHQETSRLASWFALAVDPRFDQGVAGALETNAYETLMPFYRKRSYNGTRTLETDLPFFQVDVCCRFDVEVHRGQIGQTEHSCAVPCSADGGD
jgi:hypothetical protein